MQMKKFLRKRKSVRDFKTDTLDNDLLVKLNGKLKSLEEKNDHQVKLKLYDSGSILWEKLKGKAGYSGVMINSPYYILVDRQDDDPESMIRNGYVGEAAITILAEMELDSCWISLTEVDENTKKELFGKDIKHLDYIIGFGEAVEKKPFDLEATSYRKSIGEVVFDEKLDEPVNQELLEQRGLDDLFYYLTFAPSTKNLQPWRFILRESSIDLLASFDEWDDSIYVDMGIIIYYFEELAKTAALSGSWEISDLETFEIDDKNYRNIGKYNL